MKTSQSVDAVKNVKSYVSCVTKAVFIWFKNAVKNSHILKYYYN